MIVTLKLVEATESNHDMRQALYDHRNRYVLLVKEVNWSCIPIPDHPFVAVQVGLDENGEECGWSIKPNHVWFNSNGEITVELQTALNPEIDPFEKFIQYAKNDGFIEYSEWVKIHKTA